MDVRILGALDVRDGAAILDLGLRKARVLFGILALNANRPVRRELLAEILWPEGAPQQWEGVIQSHISRLRKALEPRRSPRTASERLQTHGHSYVLVLAPQELDALRFEQALSEGRGALARGEDKAAATLLRQALGEWRGDVLADVDERLAVAAEINRLDELHLVAREGHAEASISVGEHATAVPDLEALVGRHPLRERTWELLLHALYRSGRQAEALRRYHEVRSILVSELGIEPGPALRELERAILRQDSLGTGGDRRSRPNSDAAAQRTAGNGDVVATRLEAAIAATPVPLPLWLQRPLDEFVGRERERADLRRSYDGARGSERRLVVVSGEPGVGKTRLVREFCSDLAANGAAVLGGRCVEEPLHVLQPFAEALGRLGRTMAEPLAALLPTEVATVASLVPEFAPHAPSLPALDADVQRYMMFRAISAILAERPLARPVVLVLDDLHWASPPALSLLTHLLHDDDRGPLLVIATARDADSTDDVNALLADLRRERRLDRVALRGLDQDEVGRLVALRDSSVSPAEVFAMTSGNPFYVEELVRHVAEIGGDLHGSSVPDSIRDTIARRLLRLPDSARRLLGVAAVCGQDFRLAVLADATDSRAEDVEDALASAQRAGVIHTNTARVGQYSFSHALVRTVLRDGLGPVREAHLHRRVGETLAAGGGESLATAHHLLAAASDGSDVGPGAEAALRAAADAVQRFSYDDALAILRAAHAALQAAQYGDDALACRVEVDLCSVLISIGAYDERMPLLADAWEHACRADDAELMADVVREGCGGTVNPGEPWLSRAESLRGRLDDSSPRALILAAIMSHALSQRPGEGGRDLAEWALARSAACEPGIRRSVVNFSLSVLGAWSPIERVVDLARSAVEAARQDGAAPELVEALSALRRAHLAAGDLAQSDETGREYEELVRTIRIPRYQAGVAQRRAMRALLAGRFVEAEAHAEEAVSLQPTLEFLEGLAVQLFALRFLQGRLEEVEPAVEVWSAQDPRAAWTIGHAMLLAELGQPDRAREMLEPFFVSRFATVPRDELYFLALCTAATAVIRLDDPAPAAVLYELLAPHASRVIVAAEGAVCWGSIHRFLGPLLSVGGAGSVETLGSVAADRWTRATMHFEGAIAVHERLGALPFLALDRLGFADLLDRAGGDSLRTSELRRTGHALAREIGLAVSAPAGEQALSASRTDRSTPR